MTGAQHELAEIIWATSRADEGTISATGADIVAAELIRRGYVRLSGPGDTEAAERAAIDAWTRRARMVPTYAELDVLDAALTAYRETLGAGVVGVPAQPANDDDAEQVMPRVGGKPFRCKCSANVFTKRGEIFTCNGCGTEYASDRYRGSGTAQDTPEQP